MRTVAMLVEVAVRNLVAARTRTAMLGTAIAIVTAMLVVMLSLAGGIEDNLIRSATTLSAGHVSVAGFFKSKPTNSVPVVTEASRVRAIVEERTPGLAYVVDRQRGWAKIISPTSSTQAGLLGIRRAQEQRLIDTLAHALPDDEGAGGDGAGGDGSDDNGTGDAGTGDFDRIGDRGTVILFAGMARRLGVRVGETVTLQTETRGGRTNTADLTVVAIAQDVGLLSAFIAIANADDMIALYQLNPDTTGAFWVYLDDIDDSEAAMVSVREALQEAGFRVMDYVPAPFFLKFDSVAGEDWTGQKLDLTTWRDEVGFLTWVLTAFDTLTWLMSIVLVSIIAVGIMNALYNAVRERTREIGTLRAIGMSRAQVSALIVLEAVCLGLGATVAGAVAGVGAVVAIDAVQITIPVDAVRMILLSDKLHLVVRPSSVLAAIVALTAMTGASAVWPAVRAARLPPVTAMQQTE